MAHKPLIYYSEYRWGDAQLQAMTSSLRNGFRFGEWTVEPLRGALSGPGGEERHVEPKVMDVLVQLALRAQDVVTRSELLETVWKNHVAADELLTGAISDLRQALRVDGDDTQHIETIPKVGYRLVSAIELTGPVRRQAGAPRRYLAWVVAAGVTLTVVLAVLYLQESLSPQSPPRPVSSIAVMPLTNLSGDDGFAYIADGLTDSLILQVSRIDSLRVPSYLTIRQFRDRQIGATEVAAELGVDAILEGSVLVADSRVRIIMQLIDARTDEHIWGDQFERDLVDVLQILNEIAVAVARAVDIELSPDQRKRFAQAGHVEPEAYRLFLEARPLLDSLTEDGFRQAIATLRRSIEIDGDYAPAHARLARAYLYLATWHGSADTRAVLPLARAAVDDALRIDDDIADTWFVRAMIAGFEWDWAGAERAYQAGLEIDRENVEGLIFYTNLLIAMGRFEQAVAISRPLLAINPKSPVALNEVAFATAMAGNIDDAVALSKRSLELAPDFHQTHGMLAEYYARQGKFGKVIEHLQRAELIQPDPPPASIGINGRLYGLAGDERRARARLATLLRLRRENETTSAASIALVYLGLDEYDEALRWLEIAYEERDISMVWLNVDWWYADLRKKDLRFEEMRKRMGFPGPEQ